MYYHHKGYGYSGNWLQVRLFDARAEKGRICRGIVAEVRPQGGGTLYVEAYYYHINPCIQINTWNIGPYQSPEIYIGLVAGDTEPNPNCHWTAPHLHQGAYGYSCKNDGMYAGLTLWWDDLPQWMFCES